MSWRPDSPSLARAAALVLGAALAGLGLNAARPAGVALRGFEPPSTCTASAVHEAPLVEVEPAGASEMCGQPSVVFADTRSAERFAEGHVAGALHLPCDATAGRAEHVLRALEHADTILVYGESTEEGREVAATLRRHGANGELRVLRGGFAAWQREGLACASGACHECTIAGSLSPEPKQKKEPSR